MTEFLPLWDLETLTVIGNPVKGHTNAVKCVEFSFGGCRIVSVSTDETTRVWNAAPVMPIGHPLHEGYIVRYVADSADGAYIVTRKGSARGCIRNRNTGKVV